MADKIKYQITSDGTNSGTKLKVNGEDVTDGKNVTNIWFSANGGIRWSDGDVSDPRVTLEYNTITKEENGTEIGERVSIDLTKEEMMTRTSVGKPVETSDSRIGVVPEVIDKILGYVGKVKYVPSREELEFRTEDSLNDLLTDLESENEQHE